MVFPCAKKLLFLLSPVRGAPEGCEGLPAQAVLQAEGAARNIPEGGPLSHHQEIRRGGLQMQTWWELPASTGVFCCRIFLNLNLVIFLDNYAHSPN